MIVLTVVQTVMQDNIYKIFKTDNVSEFRKRFEEYNPLGRIVNCYLRLDGRDDEVIEGAIKKFGVSNWGVGLFSEEEDLDWSEKALTSFLEGATDKVIEDWNA